MKKKKFCVLKKAVAVIDGIQFYIAKTSLKTISTAKMNTY